ncbi:hypothetical protein EVAR_55426_1 [Eumeta japonica]|uniref:Uncharacterized protein n=1 Tax=Eumeta variegata TaxID=151549 RepID=A0A4C1Z8E9_EUMVA|nr:hypothetical protein EVAR_55426_1 [Eumeta japonica]
MTSSAEGAPNCQKSEVPRRCVYGFQGLKIGLQCLESRQCLAGDLFLLYETSVRSQLRPRAFIYFTELTSGKRACGRLERTTFHWLFQLNYATK